MFCPENRTSLIPCNLWINPVSSLFFILRMFFYQAPCNCSIRNPHNTSYRPPGKKPGGLWCFFEKIRNIAFSAQKHCFNAGFMPFKGKKRPFQDVFSSSGDRTRTCDLRVMSPTSCHCSTPHRLV